MTPGFLNIPWPIWGIGALVVASIFAVFVPRRDMVSRLEGITFIIVRWFHSLVWLLLALFCFLHAIPDATINRLAEPAAALAGITYLIYMLTFVKGIASVKQSQQ